MQQPAKTLSLKKRYQQVIHWFQENVPVAETELQYYTPYELLVAVILSAQCTDKRVNMITPALFERYPTVELLAEATQDDIFELIRSCSYPNNKAKHLLGMARMLIKEYNGQVPSAMDDLVKLPGVGRKTANVIASVVFRQPALAVDTHVFRVSQRIGLVNHAKTPLEVEKQLTTNIPKEMWGIAHHWLILHGRYVCTARAPHCDTCGLKQWCKYYAEKK